MAAAVGQALLRERSFAPARPAPRRRGRWLRRRWTSNAIPASFSAAPDARRRRRDPVRNTAFVVGAVRIIAGEAGRREDGEPDEPERRQPPAAESEQVLQKVAGCANAFIIASRAPFRMPSTVRDPSLRGTLSRGPFVGAIPAWRPISRNSRG